jgi:hypothetical protein
MNDSIDGRNRSVIGPPVTSSLEALVRATEAWNVDSGRGARESTLAGGRVRAALPGASLGKYFRNTFFSVAGHIPADIPASATK